MLKFQSLFTFILAGWLVSSNSLGAGDDYYMWTDDNGVTNFSQMVPKDQNATFVNKQPPFGPKPIPDAAPETSGSADIQANERSRQLNCQIGERSLNKLENFKNIFLRGEDGWWKAISEVQRKEQISKAKLIIKENCPEPGFFDRIKQANSTNRD